MQVLLGGRLKSWQHFLVTHSRFSDAGKGWHFAPLPAGAMVWKERECHSKDRQNVAPALELRRDGQQNPQPPLGALDCRLGSSLILRVMHITILCVDLFPSVYRGPAVYMPGTVCDIYGPFLWTGVSFTLKKSCEATLAQILWRKLKFLVVR